MTDIRRASLEEIRRMKTRGELHHNADAPESDEDLGPAFWEKARLELPQSARSVHLKLDPEVFEFFKNGGKGHLTRMQNVLKAYVKAHRSS